MITVTRVSDGEWTSRYATDCQSCPSYPHQGPSVRDVYVGCFSAHAAAHGLVADLGVPYSGSHLVDLCDDCRSDLAEALAKAVNVGTP